MERTILDKRKCFLCKKMAKPLFRFPNDVNCQLLWLKSIGKEDLLQTMSHRYISNNGRLCGLHFSDKCFTSTLKQKLFKIAVPSSMENKKQASPAESSGVNSENALPLPELVSRSVEITNIPSSPIGKNSTVVLSSVHNTTSINKISGKEPFITYTAKSSLKGGVTLLNKVSEKDPLIPAVLSSQSLLNNVSGKNSTNTDVLSSQSLLNNVSGKNSTNTDVLASQTDTNSLNQISEKDPLVIDVSSHSTLLNKVTETTPKICRTMTNFASPEIAKDPAVTVITLCCTDRKEGIAFHKFLQDPKQRMRWISAVRCQNTKPTHISVLCPKHFNEEQANHPSALKENTVPNVFALDLLSQQKGVNGLQKWNEATPVNHREGTIKDEFFELQHNPKEIDKFYVKVMYDESVSKIAKRLHSSETGVITSDIDARKKLKRSKICPPSDPSHLPNIPVCSSQKSGKDLVNNVDVGEKLKKSVACSSGNTNSNNLSNFKCLQQTPAQELVKHVIVSNNSQEDTIDSSSDTNFSDLPDLPIHSPQITEKLAKRVDVSNNSQKNTIDSSCDANFSDPPDLPIHSPQITEKLAKRVDVSNNSQKNTIDSSSDAKFSDPPDLPIHLPQITGKLAKHLDVSNNSQKNTIDSSSAMNFSDPPDLPMHSLQANGEKTVNHIDGRENLKKDTTCSSSVNFASTHPVFPMRLPMKARKKLVLYANNKLRKHLEYPPRDIKNEILMHSLKNSGVKKMGNKKNGEQNSLSISKNEEKVDPVISSSGNKRIYCTTGTVTEARDLMDSSTQTDAAAEVIDSNNSHVSTEIEERTNVVPKIVDVKGGIDPFNLLEISEMKKYIKVPNEWWGITCTPKYVICSKWNEGYDPIFRVAIEKDYNVKIFIKGRECVGENKKVPLENISALLQEVDSYEICAGVSDKSMTNCIGHLENESGKPFSIWCKECQRKGRELMNKYKKLQELQ